MEKVRIEVDATQCTNCDLRYMTTYAVRGQRLHNEPRTIDMFLDKKKAEECADSYRAMRDNEDMVTIYDFVWVTEQYIWV